MAVKTREELLNTIKTKFGDQTDDETIAILEDVTDTFTDLETKANGDGEDWKAKYEENDASWRKKYTERFYNADPKDEPPKPDEGDEEAPKTYADLFKTE